jgi:beta-lactamase regulating signal transducer with metallopeptidase domain
MERLLVECTVRATLIATVIAVVLWVARIKTPVALHAAWTGVLLSMLLLPIWTAWGPKASMRVLPTMPAQSGLVAMLPTEILQAKAPQADRRSLVTAARAPAQTQGPDGQRVLLGIYMLVTCALLVRLAVGTVRTRRLVRRAVMRDGRLTSASCASPVTVGWLRPVAVLPEWWLHWPEAQLEAVLTHEREHVRRRDALVQWLALLNRAVFWFHPLAWWLERRLAALAEEACDAAVLARGHDARDYAEYLLDLARAVTRAGSRVKVVGMALPGPRLARRIRQILNSAPAPRISRVRMACTAAVCAVSSAVCAAATLEHADPQRPGELSRFVLRFQQPSWLSGSPLLQQIAPPMQTTTPTAPARAVSRAEEILVTVNGEGLTNTDITQRHQELEQTIARPDSSGIWRRRSGANARRPRVLVDAADDTLIVQRGRQLGYTLTDDEFKSELDVIKKLYKFENDAQFLAALKRIHLTMEDHRRNMERRMILGRVRVEEVAVKSVFTEDEQRQYFEAHLNEFPLMRFEQARELIDLHAVEPKLQQRKWDKYLATLRSKAVIEWKRADLKRAYADGLAQQAKAPN